MKRFVLVGLLVSVLVAGCSSSSDGEDASSPTDAPSTDTTATTTPAVERPAGPAADVSEELTGGNGVYLRSPIEGQLDPTYVEHEYVAAGTATSYRAVGELGGDGQWTFEPDTSAEYRTRVVVRRPEETDDVSGVVLVEWLNVSGGVDSDAEWVATHEEITRRGHIWVGVTAQVLGIEGGPVVVKVDVPGAEDAGKGAKALDPARYGSLAHPGDGYSFDIYTQVARALREGGEVLGGVEPTHVIAVGQSQSAFALTTYLNGVAPLTRAFDGYFVHSRGKAGLPLVGPGESTGIADALGGTATIIRTDTDVPVFEMQTEGDPTSIIGSLPTRQPDTDHFRLWEVAGTSHADTRYVGERIVFIDCGVPANDGPLHVVAKAALRHLVAWIAEGTAPPEMPLLEVSVGETPELRRDGDGIVLGGVRTPPVDVPTRVLSSVKGPVDSAICLLLGSTAPLPEARIAELYPARADFEEQYATAIDEAIDAGVVLDEDRAAIETYAHPELVTE